MLLKSGLLSSVFLIDKISSNSSIYKYMQFYRTESNEMELDGKQLFFLTPLPMKHFFLILDCASAGNKIYLNIYFIDLYPTFCS